MWLNTGPRGPIALKPIMSAPIVWSLDADAPRVTGLAEDVFRRCANGSNERTAAVVTERRISDYRKAQLGNTSWQHGTATRLRLSSTLRPLGLPKTPAPFSRLSAENWAFSDANATPPAATADTPVLDSAQTRRVAVHRTGGSAAVTCRGSNSSVPSIQTEATSPPVTLTFTEYGELPVL